MTYCHISLQNTN